MNRLRTYLPEDEARDIEARAWHGGIELAIVAAAKRGEALSRRDVAAMLGVDESYLRAVCKGNKPIGSHRLAQLPLHVRECINAERDRLTAPVAPGLVVAPCTAVARVGKASADLMAEALAAIEDGVITDDELTRIRAAIENVERAGRKCRASSPSLEAVKERAS